MPIVILNKDNKTNEKKNNIIIERLNTSLQYKLVTIIDNNKKMINFKILSKKLKQY